jgi:hypothetical protein
MFHLNSSESFVATSLEDRPSSTTFRSTPRSAALLDDDGRAGVCGQRTKPSKSPCWCSLSFPYEYGEVWIVLLQRWVRGQDELSVGQKSDMLTGSCGGHAAVAGLPDALRCVASLGEKDSDLT